MFVIDASLILWRNQTQGPLFLHVQREMWADGEPLWGSYTKFHVQTVYDGKKMVHILSIECSVSSFSSDLTPVSVKLCLHGSNPPAVRRSRHSWSEPYVIHRRERSLH